MSIADRPVLDRSNRLNQNINLVTAVESSLTTWISVVTINCPVHANFLF